MILQQHKGSTKACYIMQENARKGKKRQEEREFAHFIVQLIF